MESKPVSRSFKIDEKQLSKSKDLACMSYDERIKKGLTSLKNRQFISDIVKAFEIVHNYEHVIADYCAKQKNPLVLW